MDWPVGQRSAHGTHADAPRRYKASGVGGTIINAAYSDLIHSGPLSYLFYHPGLFFDADSMSHGKQFTLYTCVGGPNGWYVPRLASCM